MAPSLSRRLLAVCLIALLGFHALFLVTGFEHNSVTIDEFSHVSAGLSYWDGGSFFLYHHNPPLVKMLASLPVLFASPSVSFSGLEKELDRAQHWRIGREFMKTNAENYVTIMRLARYPVVFLSVVAAWFLWCWGRELWDTAGGLLAVSLWVFQPEVLAHAGLATVDLGATAFGVIASYEFWNWLKHPTWPRVLVAGVLLGAAWLSKFTMLLLGPIWFAVWLLLRTVELVRHKPADTLHLSEAPLTHKPSATREAGSTLVGALMRQLIQGAVAVLVTVLAVNAGYCFQGTGQSLGSFSFLSSALRGKAPRNADGGDGFSKAGTSDSQPSRNRFAHSCLGRLPVPLPREFVLGFDEQLQHAEVREDDMPARFTFYLNGERRRQGWWYYYLYGMLLKTPIGVLALVLTAIGALFLAREYRGTAADELVLWLTPLTIIGAMSLGTEINIGVRYILPAWPYLILSVARLGRAWSLRDWPMRLLVVAWFAWAAVSTMRIHPHYLSYFNELAGGPDNGWRYLADSNIDWGQDLLEFKTWIDKHPEAQPITIAYAGTVDPHILGLEYELPASGFIKSGDWDRYGPRPGWHAVSVNLVVGLPFWTTDENGESRPTKEDEFGYFRLFDPVAKAGYSIFIYHITQDQANEARKKLGLPELSQETSTQKRARA